MVPLPVNEKEVVLAKRFDPGWSGVTHQNNNEACEHDQGAERKTDLAGTKRVRKKEPVTPKLKSVFM